VVRAHRAAAGTVAARLARWARRGPGPRLVGRRVLILLLSCITYDGLRETGLGAVILATLLPPIQVIFGQTVMTLLLVDSVAAAAHAATLMPIAAGYLVAHYLTLVVQAAIWLPSLLTDPLMSLAPDIGWIPIGFVWYLSVAAIVVGHVAGVVLAHRLALRLAPRHAVRAGLPMVLLMIGYTILSLWIIAQPIVIEPGAGGPGAGNPDAG